MALALRKNTNRGIVGLDLDGQYLSAVQLAGDGVTRAVSMELAPGMITDGEVTDVAALSDALKDFFKTHNLPRRVRLGVSNQQIVVRHLELPKIDDEKELAAAVRFQASEAIAMPLDEVVLDHQVIGETITPEGSARLRVVVVAARESMVARIVEAVRGAGLRVGGVAQRVRRGGLLEPHAVRQDVRELAHHQLPVDAALGQLLDGAHALLLDLREVAVGAELRGLGLVARGVGLGLGHVAAGGVDRVDREHVDEHADEHGTQDAEEDVGAALAAAARAARAMLLGEKVDRPHAVAPSARPTEMVWR